MAHPQNRFAVNITCPECGQTGYRAWQQGEGGGQERGGTRVFTSVSQGFHKEEGRMPSGDPIIVCDNCDEIQPD